jgi:hypothetical protein
VLAGAITLITYQVWSHTRRWVPVDISISDAKSAAIEFEVNVSSPYVIQLPSAYSAEHASWKLWANGVMIGASTRGWTGEDWRGTGRVIGAFKGEKGQKYKLEVIGLNGIGGGARLRVEEAASTYLDDSFRDFGAMIISIALVLIGGMTLLLSVFARHATISKQANGAPS